MNSIARACFLSVLTGVLILSHVSVTYAETYDCDKYAKDAVYAQNWSQHHGCRFGGPQWSYDYNGHKGWCMTAPEPWKYSEAGIRAELITACKNADTDCLAYSKTAIAQNW